MGIIVIIGTLIAVVVILVIAGLILPEEKEQDAIQDSDEFEEISEE